MAPNIEFYELDPPPQRLPHRRGRSPYPAVPGYSIRDYGNRVGHMPPDGAAGPLRHPRLDLAVAPRSCDHHPEIIELCAERDWEFFSHGIYNTRYTYGLTEDQEREMILDSMRHHPQRTGGHRPSGYLAPALSHSEHHAGPVRRGWAARYTCDLFHDDQPTPITVRGGKRVRLDSRTRWS